MEVDAWKDWMTLVGMSDDTIRRSLLTVSQLIRWAAPNPLPAITAAMFEQWLGQWTHPATRHAYLYDVRRYYRWAIPRGVCATDPTSGIGTIAVPDTLPKPIDDDILVELLPRLVDDRVRLALLLAGMAGLRRAEIVGLDWSDVHLGVKKPMLTVRRGKGAKDRAVPIHPELARELSPPKRSGPVVARLDGRPMSRGYLGKLVSEALHEADIAGGVHRGRHRFGTVAAEGGDLQAVADLMGHADMRTTLGYVKLAGARRIHIIEAMPGLSA